MIFNSNKLKTYQWTAINTQGKKITGDLQANSKREASTQLKQQPLRLLHIYQKYSFPLLFELNSIPSVVVLFFFRQLATLITAGIPIVQSFNILSKSHDNAAFQHIILSIKNQLESGKTLAASLRKYPRYFDTLSCQFIQVGEQTGNLSIMLKRVATHKENMLSLKKKITQSLFYPALLLLVALLVSVIMLTFVVPRFADLFQSMQGSLPALTVFVIQLSHGVHYYGWLLFTFIFGIFFICKYITPAFLKPRFEALILKAPLIGQILSKIILARFARSLAIALNAGIPMTESLKMLAEASGNDFFERIILHLQLDVAKGQQLHQSMQKYSIFPNMMTQMIKIGEESGMLGQMLEKIAEIYESDADHFVNTLAHALEPLIMIILGVLIGGLVIAMYLPIFKLGTLM